MSSTPIARRPSFGYGRSMMFELDGPAEWAAFILVSASVLSSVLWIPVMITLNWFT